MKSHGRTTIFLLSILIQVNKENELAACGQLQNVLESRITNGRDTHRWPWHAAIYHQSNYQCGGTLVASKFVLTAAHCVLVAAEQVTVSLGRRHLNASQSSAPFVKVAEILVHPNYEPENYENDIAIITLATDAIFNSYVQPICMWKSDKVDLSEVIGKLGTVVGWGLTEKGETSNVLQEASLPVVPSFECLKSNRDVFGRFLADTNFCAGTRNGTSVCTGDSGGSITFQEGVRFYIRGVVSVGANKLVDRSTNKFMCDSMQYAIFTDVAQYLPWIREIIQCETVVRCGETGVFTYCGVHLQLEEVERECKIIFESTSSLTQELEITGDKSIAVPDLSNAVEKFIKLGNLKLRSFNTVKRSRLSPFRNIVDLTLKSFSFTQLDADIFVDLTYLESLTIQFGNLTALPAEVFRSNEKMRKLYLGSNRLLELHSDVFDKIRNVDELRLDGNRLEILPANIFRNNEKMRELHLNGNYLSEVHEDLFNGLTNLEFLSLSSNQILYLTPGLFRSNARLTDIRLSDNKIKKIDVDFTTMTQLSYIALTGNNCIDEDFEVPDSSLRQANEKIRRACAN